jgi:hypothetical protein
MKKVDFVERRKGNQRYIFKIVSESEKPHTKFYYTKSPDNIDFNSSYCKVLDVILRAMTPEEVNSYFEGFQAGYLEGKVTGENNLQKRIKELLI